ncbi:MAG: imelysin family protein [Balneolaceae bacterium]
MKKIVTLILLSTVVFYACKNDGPSGPDVSDFDRQAILENWADEIIIPAFTSFEKQTSRLDSAGVAFTTEPTMENLKELRSEWEDAYISFQHVSMFEMGRAMELRYRDNLNIYPTDTAEIQQNIEEDSYNLELPSLNNSQGFPALDYLLFGLAESDSDILAHYTSNTNAENYRNYLGDLTSRIDELTSQVLNDWTENYRDEFVQNSANSSNSSVDMMVNDYIYYYEKNLRAGKVGIPAGVFSGTPLSTHVEAYYHGNLSKTLLKEAIDASQNFFQGNHFNSTGKGESLESYLDFLNTMKQGADLSELINNQFLLAKSEAENLDENFSMQVELDNSKMLETYDKLQKNVVLLKVDMLQALNINVDYVDADGD